MAEIPRAAWWGEHCHLLLHFQACLQVWGLHMCSVTALGNMTSKQSCINLSFIRHAQEPVLCVVALQPVPQQQTHHFEFTFLSHLLLRLEALSHSCVVSYSTVLFWKLCNYGFPQTRSRLFNFLTCQGMRSPCHMSRGKYEQQLHEERHKGCNLFINAVVEELLHPNVWDDGS